MKKTLVPVVLLVIAAMLFTSLPAMAWNHYRGPGPGWYGMHRPPPPPPRYYHRGGHRGPGVGGVVAGLVVGGLVAGTVVAATRPPVQVVQQPVYVPPPVVMQQPVIVQQQPVVMQQLVPQMCTEERRVSGEYQYDARGNAVWVEFAHPVLRAVQVPCQ
ncbi:MAG TPA: hypothetical protein DEB25_07405 [Desulfobulbaceae bacterium]|nr:hypothetical protein [Desulfobulbaceae bacterium]